jgi:hypothetical protein
MKMIPVWFPWALIGGVAFIALSFIGTKYKDKDYKKIQFLQDFISGTILVAFAGVLVPDIFPKLDFPSLSIPSGMSGGDSSDFDLQVGPPRLAGR